MRAGEHEPSVHIVRILAQPLLQPLDLRHHVGIRMPALMLGGGLSLEKLRIEGLGRAELQVSDECADGHEKSACKCGIKPHAAAAAGTPLLSVRLLKHAPFKLGPGFRVFDLSDIACGVLAFELGELLAQQLQAFALAGSRAGIPAPFQKRIGKRPDSERAQRTGERNEREQHQWFPPRSSSSARFFSSAVSRRSVWLTITFLRRSAT